MTHLVLLGARLLAAVALLDLDLQGMERAWNGHGTGMERAWNGDLSVTLKVM